MIEVIYKDEKQTAKGNEESFNLPKNIRQIGIPNEKYRIYIEDYVYTFLKKIAEKAEEEEKGAAAVFTGEIKWNSGTGYLFIRGALTAEAGEISAEHVEFSDLTWQKLHEEIEHYFAGQEIIGWFLTQKSLQMEVTEGVQRIHMKLFGGEKALMLMAPVCGILAGFKGGFKVVYAAGFGVCLVSLVIILLCLKSTSKAVK